MVGIPARPTLTAAASARDAARAVEAVLKGGVPERQDLVDEFRGDGSWGYTPLGARVLGSPSSRAYGKLPALCRRAAAQRLPRLAVAFWALTGAPVKAVCDARWVDLDRDATTFTAWHWRSQRCGVTHEHHLHLRGTAAAEVIACAYDIARGADDGTGLYIRRLRAVVSDADSENWWRSFLQLPPPRPGHGHPQGLVFTEGKARRRVPPARLHALLRDGAEEVRHAHGGALPPLPPPDVLLASLSRCPAERDREIAPHVRCAL